MSREIVSEIVSDVRDWLQGCTRLQLVEHAIVFGVTLHVIRSAHKLGPKRVVGKVMRALIDNVPGASGALDAQLESEVGDAVAEMFEGAPPALAIGVPKQGIAIEEVKSQLATLKNADVDPADGKAFAYVYTPFEKSVKSLAEDAAMMFMSLNALNPTAFPSLRKMEVEVVSMCKEMTGSVDGVTGSMTSGGTESILMAVKTAREYARKVRGIDEPECVLPSSAHPAFFKAGHYLGVKMVWVAVDPRTMEADINKMAAACNRNTILIVGSAPQYPHGILDPIQDLAALAKRTGCLMHVDACFGGFVLPWLKEAGYDIAPWDFSVDGVTSISMDVHKYGFSVKGASCIMYRSRELRINQFYAYSEWSGGLFVSPSMLGTRAGGPIASAWATMRALGRDGFVKSTKMMMETANYFKEEIAKTDGVEVIGSPCMSAIAIRASASSLNIYAVADVMEAEGGWRLERNKDPASLHLTIMPPHTQTREKFIADMRKAIATVRADAAKFNTAGSAAMYGMIATIPDGAVVDTFVAKWMDYVYTPEPKSS
eukprot:m.252463 g.252463  ORF g.252463 m.252463 type:complete len:542 (+) comp19566_c0_seq1:61-1686(+)